jgi:hypothetical protein
LNQNKSVPLRAATSYACASSSPTSKKSRLFVVALTCFVLWPALASAAVTLTTEQSRLVPQQSSGHYQGGYALDGDTLAIGESASANSSCTNTVAIRERNLGGTNHWGLRKAITPTGSSDCSGFGRPYSSIALKGDTLVVGSPHVGRRQSERKRTEHRQYRGRCGVCISAQ